jgi:hypothetical protein
MHLAARHARCKRGEQMLSPRAHTWIRLLALATILAAATFPRTASRDRGLLASAKTNHPVAH